MSVVFNPDFERGNSEVVEPFVKPLRRRFVAEFEADFHVPLDVKVSCQKADLCHSPSRRLKGFVCGDNYSHDDRVCGCVEYCRLHRGIHDGVRGGRPI